MTAGLTREINSGNALSARLGKSLFSMVSCCSRRSAFCVDSIIPRSDLLSSHGEFRSSRRTLVCFIIGAVGCVMAESILFLNPFSGWPRDEPHIPIHGNLDDD